MKWKNKKVLVTGSEGMIGKELVILLKINLSTLLILFLLVDKNAIVTKKYLFNLGGQLSAAPIDLTYKEGVEMLFKTFKPDFIFHLVGIKGNPKMTKERPVDFMGPMLQFDTNMILAAQKYNVKKFLYTSSIAVENPESDKYPAWAKQTAETLIQAMRIQYPKGTEYCIVRPANVYGRYDNLNTEYPMVVTKLIKEALANKKLVLDRKGSEQIRDFINAKDVAKGMIKAMEEMPTEPVNLCSKYGASINALGCIIAQELNIPIEYKDLNLVLGPDKKVMGNPYITPEVTLQEGIKEILLHVKEKP